jgi:hypothetical protein
MKKLRSKKPALDDYDKNDNFLDSVDRIELPVGWYYDAIENMLDNKPSEGIERKQWMKRINELIDECNQKAGSKIYTKIR